MALQVNNLVGFGGGGGAFPVVEGVAISSDPGGGGGGTEKTIDLPPNIVSGELILLVLVFIRSAIVDDWDVVDNFTEILQQQNGNDLNLAIGYRIADGSEGSTTEVHIDSSDQGVHIAYRISGAAATAPTMPATMAADNNADPDPNSFSPAYGRKSTLWIAVAGNFRKDFTAPPAFYSNFQTLEVNNASVGTAERQRSTATEDPGVFTAASGAWLASVVAIKPV